MTRNEIEILLNEIRDGKKSVDEALEVLQNFPYTDLGYAKIDHHREMRTGYPEIVYCAGKTADQVVGIFRLMSDKKEQCDRNQGRQGNVRIGKGSDSGSCLLSGCKDNKHPCEETRNSRYQIAVITAGTSDMPVAEEAAVTAELLGNNVVRIYDAGVAGIHRLVDKLPEIKKCRVIIVIAGNGGRSCKRCGRTCRQTGDCRTHQCWLRSQLRWYFSAARDAYELFVRCYCCKYR